LKPKVWITDFVDYSNKYGIGYNLSNGRVGVYFNDGTKMFQYKSHHNHLVQYIYKKPIQNGNANNKVEVSEQFDLRTYPEYLKKKCVLFQNFEKYLANKGKKVEQNTPSDSVNMKSLKGNL
jgi:polo-like kinase 1